MELNEYRTQLSNAKMSADAAEVAFRDGRLDEGLLHALGAQNASRRCFAAAREANRQCVVQGGGTLQAAALAASHAAGHAARADALAAWYEGGPGWMEALLERKPHLRAVA